MDYELAKQLNDAGFPQTRIGVKGDNLDKYAFKHFSKEPVSIPTLSELIEACFDDKKQFHLDSSVETGMWYAISGNEVGNGATPEEAVARLWLELNKKV